jgi:hypothetical protein
MLSQAPGSSRRGFWATNRIGHYIDSTPAVTGRTRVPSLTPSADDDWTRRAGRQNEDIETIDAFWAFAKRSSR